VNEFDDDGNDDDDDGDGDDDDDNDNHCTYVCKSLSYYRPV
jgi:hypothetical protein